MARSRHMTRGFSQAPKRQIANDGLSVGGGSATMTFGASVAGSALGSLAFALIIPAATLVRTRGSWSAMIRTSGGTNNHLSIVMGMYVATDEAFGVGLTALQTPIESIENDWYVYEPTSLVSEITNPGNDSIVSNFRGSFDSRGQRKLKAGDVLVTVFEGSQSDATTGTIIELSYFWRSQFKL